MEAEGAADRGSTHDIRHYVAEDRAYASYEPIESIRRYANEAVSDDFSDNPYALQDIANEIGKRLGFTIEHGVYRGRSGKPGYDGLWLNPDTEHTILIEVKTSVTYTIRLVASATYRLKLIADGRLTAPKSSVLIVIGNSGDDTADLEAQIRGSRYSWDVRLATVDGLLQMVQLKDATDDPASMKMLREILVPKEYTKVDQLLEVMNHVAQDISAKEEAEIGNDSEDAPREGAYVSRLNKEDLRILAKEVLNKQLGVEFRDISGTLLESADGKTAVCYSPSKPYRQKSLSQFWFGLHKHQEQFLNAHPKSFVAYHCVGTGLAIVPWRAFAKHLDSMTLSTVRNRTWRHVIIQYRDDGHAILRLRADSGQSEVDLSKWFYKQNGNR